MGRLDSGNVKSSNSKETFNITLAKIVVIVWPILIASCFFITFIKLIPKIKMSADQLSQKLQQDLFNELLTTNHLLQLISQELHEIKQMTSPGGEFEANVAKNAVLVKALADLQQLDLEKLPPLVRMQIDLNHSAHHNQSHEHHDTFRNNSTMEESQ